MNPIEQRIQGAAPELDPADPSYSLVELQILLASNDKPEQLTPGNSAIYRRAGARRRGSARWALRFVPLAAILLMGIMQMVPQGSQDSGEAGVNLVLPEPQLPWRTVTLSRPWVSGPQLSATFDLPAEWQVRRHQSSHDFPGLHATVRDQEGLAVAMLYLGPAPAGALAWTCVQFPATGVELDRHEVQTGAEILDPRLTSAYRYELEAGEETRGTFGLVPSSSGGTFCSTGPDIVPPGQMIFRFGDALRVPTAKAPQVPRSGYARTFTIDDDARTYLASREYASLRRMMTSVSVNVPADTSSLWELSPGRAPGHW